MEFRQAWDRKKQSFMRLECHSKIGYMSEAKWFETSGKSFLTIAIRYLCSSSNAVREVKSWRRKKNEAHVFQEPNRFMAPHMNTPKDLFISLTVEYEWKWKMVIVLFLRFAPPNEQIWYEPKLRVKNTVIVNIKRSSHSWIRRWAVCFVYRSAVIVACERSVISANKRKQVEN